MLDEREDEGTDFLPFLRREAGLGVQSLAQDCQYGDGMGLFGRPGTITKERQLREDDNHGLVCLGAGGVGPPTNVPDGGDIVQADDLAITCQALLFSGIALKVERDLADHLLVGGSGIEEGVGLIIGLGELARRDDLCCGQDVHVEAVVSDIPDEVIRDAEDGAVLPDKDHLALEFTSLQPVVIAVAFSDPFAAGLGMGEDIVDDETAVFVGAEDTDFIGVFGQPLLTDGDGAVCGGIVGNDKLEGEVGLLSDDGLDGTANGRLGVVGAHEDGDERGLRGVWGRRAP